MDIFHFILGPIRGVLVWFDSVVYGFIPELYKLMLYLADVDLVSNNVPVQALIQRIYILIGVFMLFKLSFSIMNYIVNPDAFSDQSKGFTNLVKRVMIAIVLLVSIPWIFTKLYEIQGEILTSNILSRFILGESTPVKNKKINKTELEKTIETSAKDVQFLLFGPFYSLNYDTDDFKDGNKNLCEPDQKRPSKHIIGSVDMGSDKECLDKVATLMDNDPTIVASDVNINDFFRYEGDNGDKRDFSQFSDLASWTLSNGEFAINYNPIISTLCGGYLVFLLLSFCIDVAGRIFRLLFLQILSPIAVISSIDPTSSGDRLKDWGTECLKVWASLYLRMGVFFLIIQLVRVITNTIYAGDSFITTSSYSGNSVPVWLYIFLVLGIFNAVGKIPELIEKATGLKMSGDLQLNPFKALSENVALQRGLGVATGVGIGAIGAATGAGIGRIFSGAANGLMGKNALDVQKKMVEGNRTMRNARSDGSTFGGRLRARATNFFGNQGALGKIEDEKVEMENEIHRLEGVKSDVDAQKQERENSIMLEREQVKNNQSVITAIDRIKNRASSKAKQEDYYRNEMARAEAARLSAEQIKGNDSASAARREQLLQNARKIEAAAEKWAATTGAIEWYENNRDDAELRAAMSDYNVAADTAGQARQTSASDIWSQQDDIKIENGQISETIAPIEREIEALNRRSNDISGEINMHQEAIKQIDQRHAREQSNYTAVGGQSGGTTVPNATARPDAGQHYGSTNFFGPMGPPSGGGYGPGHGPGGPGPRNP